MVDFTMKELMPNGKSIIILIIGLLIIPIQAQTGLGGAGTLYYPGFYNSDLHNSRFGLGGGFEIFARHKLFEIKPDIVLHARYNYRRYYDRINLPSAGTTNFNFTYLSISVLFPLIRFNAVTFYGGGGFNMATITSSSSGYYFNKVAEASLLPDIFSGVEWYLGKNYNVFAEICFQYGQVRVNHDLIPLTGLRFSLGATMFLIAEE
jgi:hypothetical protein